MNAVEDSLPNLILCSHQITELTTQYFIELELLASAESTLSSISDDFSLLPLVLSAAKDGSEFETQSPDQILADEDELGEVVNMVAKDSQLELKIRGPSIGQINN